MDKIKEIEGLRKAVIEKHYPQSMNRCLITNYRDEFELRRMEDAEIDRKVLFYVQIGINADDLKSN